MRTMLAAAAAMVLGGCVGPSAPDDRAMAVQEDIRDDAQAQLRDANGREVAEASLRMTEAGVLVRIEAKALARGAYGSHVHAVGRCDAPGFESAGAHWNPTGAKHGRDNPAGAHMGDLPNLVVGTAGRGSVEFVVPGATLGGGPRGMLDADGSAILIHAAADDYRTDPSGNSGARIACGVLG